MHLKSGNNLGLLVKKQSANDLGEIHHVLFKNPWVTFEGIHMAVQKILEMKI